MAVRLRGTRLGDAALDCPHALKMGAVFPDIPSYVTGDSPPARLAEAVGNAYHGTHGEDTHVLLRTLLTALQKRDSPEARAFLAGVVSHLHADQVFHPLVYFLTGNYHDVDPEKRTRAVRDHRRFEVLLDVHVCSTVKKRLQDFRARSFLNGSASQGLFDWTKEASSGPALKQMLQAAVKKYLTAQGVFIHRGAALCARAMDPWLPASLRELTALFYRPGRQRHRMRLRQEITYRNPVSGEMGEATVDELLERAVSEGAALCRRLESFLVDKKDVRLLEPGPSLNFGLVGADVSLARYFAETPFFST